jgi:hypothetical protein
MPQLGQCGAITAGDIGHPVGVCGERVYVYCAQGGNHQFVDVRGSRVERRAGVRQRPLPVSCDFGSGDSGDCGCAGGARSGGSAT